MKLTAAEASALKRLAKLEEKRGAPPPPPLLRVQPPPERWQASWDAVPLDGRRVSDVTTRVILLVRHGQYQEAATESARALTPLGRLQALTTGARLRAKISALGCAMPTEIIHSTLTRARETAMIMRDAAFPGAILVGDGDLREGAPCHPDPNWWKPADADVQMDRRRLLRAFERYVHRELAQQASPSAAHTGDGICTDSSDDDGQITGAPAEKAAPAPSEAGPVFTGGAAACAPQPSDGAKHSVTVLVAHGNVIRWMVLKALQLNEEAWLRLIVPHASITTLLITPAGDVLLSGLGEAGHLEAYQVT